MAAVIDLQNMDYSTKKGRMLMNKLRDSGQEYISNKGELVPAKVQPSSYCMCPQQCSKKLTPKNKWKDLFDQFYKLGDQSMQNKFLQTHIEIKQVHFHNFDSAKPSPANKRRVTCKYYVPNLVRGGKIEDHMKGRCDDAIQVCQRAFMSVFAITEKRLRMQREKNIAMLEFEQARSGIDSSSATKEAVTSSSDNELTPLDLSRLARKLSNNSEQPLDLSNPLEKTINSIEIDKSKLYEIAAMMGVPKRTVDREMASKYVELVKKNLRKHQKDLLKQKRKGDVPESKGNFLRGITEQVVGLQDELTILPMQTLNNGDLTITPILGMDTEPVENQDIMQVNSFFQNQLWKPEYLGLQEGKSPAVN